MSKLREKLTGPAALISALFFEMVAMFHHVGSSTWRWIGRIWNR
jgi:hypothetical protein